MSIKEILSTPDIEYYAPVNLCTGKYIADYGNSNIIYENNGYSAEKIIQFAGKDNEKTGISVMKIDIDFTKRISPEILNFIHKFKSVGARLFISFSSAWELLFTSNILTDISLVGITSPAMGRGDINIPENVRYYNMNDIVSQEILLPNIYENNNNKDENVKNYCEAINRINTYKYKEFEYINKNFDDDNIFAAAVFSDIFNKIGILSFRMMIDIENSAVISTVEFVKVWRDINTSSNVSIENYGPLCGYYDYYVNTGKTAPIVRCLGDVKKEIKDNSLFFMYRILYNMLYDTKKIIDDAPLYFLKFEVITNVGYSEKLFDWENKQFVSYISRKNILSGNTFLNKDLSFGADKQLGADTKIIQEYNEIYEIKADKWRSLVNLIEYCTKNKKEYSDNEKDLYTFEFGKSILKEILSYVFEEKFNKRNLLSCFDTSDGSDIIINRYNNIITYFNDLLMKKTYIKGQEYLKDWTSKDYQVVLLLMIYLANAISKFERTKYYYCKEWRNTENIISIFALEDFLNDSYEYNFSPDIVDIVKNVFQNNVLKTFILNKLFPTIYNNNFSIEPSDNIVSYSLSSNLSIGLKYKVANRLENFKYNFHLYYALSSLFIVEPMKHITIKEEIEREINPEILFKEVEVNNLMISREEVENVISEILSENNVDIFSAIDDYGYRSLSYNYSYSSYKEFIDVVMSYLSLLIEEKAIENNHDALVESVKELVKYNLL